jgi:flavin-dependent dehydrogenase
VLAVAWGGRRARLRIPERLVVDRARFDADLAGEAAAAGAVFMPGCGARVLAGGVELRREGGRREVVDARAVIVAAGRGGAALREDARFGWDIAAGSAVGLGAVVEAPGGASAIRMFCGRRGYAGLAALGAGRVVVAAAVRGGSRGAREVVAGLVGRGAPGVAGALRGVPQLSRRRRTVEADGRVFVIGDAAGYVEPFTGEGMAWGIEQGLAVVRHAVAAIGGGYRPGDWTAELRGLQRRRQRACRVLAGVLRRPAVASAAVAACGAAPGWGDALGEIFGGRAAGCRP